MASPLLLYCWDIHVTLWEASRSWDTNIPSFSSFGTRNPRTTQHPIPPLFYSTIYSWISAVTRVLGQCHPVLIALQHHVALVLKRPYWRTLRKSGTANRIFLRNLPFSSTSWLSSKLTCVTQLSINIDFRIRDTLARRAVTRWNSTDMGLPWLPLIHSVLINPTRSDFLLHPPVPAPPQRRLSTICTSG